MKTVKKKKKKFLQSEIKTILFIHVTLMHMHNYISVFFMPDEQITKNNSFQEQLLISGWRGWEIVM